MAKVLYISDLDGTLLNQNAEVSRYTEDTLNKLIADGMNFTVATARTSATALRIMSGVNLNIPVVLMNGVLIYDVVRREYEKIEIIKPSTAEKVIDILRQHNISGFIYGIKNNIQTTYYESDMVNSPALRAFYDERTAKYYKSFVKVSNFKDITTENIAYFTLIDIKEQVADVYEQLRGMPELSVAMYRDIYTEDLWYVEAFSATASKYTAAMFLRKKYGYDKLIGFGDNYNDMPLVEACDEFYAVGNAVEEVKAVASGVISANTTDGIAAFLIAEKEKNRI